MPNRYREFAARGAVKEKEEAEKEEWKIRSREGGELMLSAWRGGEKFLAYTILLDFLLLGLCLGKRFGQKIFMAKKQHERTDNSMINPRCKCGWKGEVTNLKNKSDAQLCMEADDLFNNHVIQEGDWK